MTAERALANDTVKPSTVPNAKRKVAAAFAASVVDIYGTNDPRCVARDVYDLLLRDLRAAYDFTVAVVFDAQVPLPTPKAFLFGEIIARGTEAKCAAIPMASLKLENDQALTALVHVKDPSASASVAFELSYRVTHVGIANDSDDERPTEWYKLEKADQVVRVGATAITVPVPLRKLMTAPVFVRQDWKPSTLASADEQMLEDAGRYDVDLVYDAMYIPQDAIHLTVEYGSGGTRKAFSSDALLRALVAFHHTYAATRSLIARLGKEAASTTISTAVKSFIKAVSTVGGAFAEGRSPAVSALAASSQEKYLIQEPKVTRMAGDIARVDPKKTLEASEGALPASREPSPNEWIRRRITLGEIDALRYESVSARMVLRRNETLKPNGKVVDAFVYETPEIRFGKPALPFVERGERINLAKVGGPGARPLAVHLQRLLEKLVFEQRTIDLCVGYRFDLLGRSGQPGRVLSTPMRVLASTPVEPAQLKMLSERVARELTTWLQSMDASPEGRIVFDARVYASGDDRAVVRCTNIELALRDIQ